MSLLQTTIFYLTLVELGRMSIPGVTFGNMVSGSPDDMMDTSPDDTNTVERSSGSPEVTEGVTGTVGCAVRLSVGVNTMVLLGRSLVSLLVVVADFVVTG